MGRRRDDLELASATSSRAPGCQHRKYHELLLATGLADVGRHECCAVHDVQRLSRLAVVVLAEWHDVPALVGGTIFLDMGAHFWLFRAGFLCAIRRKCSAAKILPMVQPCATLAGIVARSVDVVYLHHTLLCEQRPCVHERSAN